MFGHDKVLVSLTEVFVQPGAIFLLTISEKKTFFLTLRLKFLNMQTIKQSSIYKCRVIHNPSSKYSRSPTTVSHWPSFLRYFFEYKSC